MFPTQVRMHVSLILIHVYNQLLQIKTCVGKIQSIFLAQSKGLKSWGKSNALVFIYLFFKGVEKELEKWLIN
jgi:hypothetical protein